jgi:hypothetical protein
MCGIREVVRTNFSKHIINYLTITNKTISGYLNFTILKRQKFDDNQQTTRYITHDYNNKLLSNDNELMIEIIIYI